LGVQPHSLDFPPPPQVCGAAQVPQSMAVAQPSEIYPHCAPSWTQDLGKQAEVPQRFGPPPPQTWPLIHSPQSIFPPQPSGAEPHSASSCAHVLGTHSVGPPSSTPSSATSLAPSLTTSPAVSEEASCGLALDMFSASSPLAQPRALSINRRKNRGRIGLFTSLAPTDPTSLRPLTLGKTEGSIHQRIRESRPPLKRRSPQNVNWDGFRAPQGVKTKRVYERLRRRIQPKTHAPSHRSPVERKAPDGC